MSPGTSSPVRVLLVDDDAAFAELMRLVLTLEGEIDIVGHACDGSEGVRLARALRPDVVVMDLNMPHMDGFEATRRISDGARRPPRVVVVSSSADPGNVGRALAAGAESFLPKDRATIELPGEIRRVAGSRGRFRLSLRTRMSELGRLAATPS